MAPGLTPSQVATLALFARHPDGVRPRVVVSRDFVGEAARRAPEATLWCDSTGLPLKERPDVDLLELADRGLLVVSTSYFTRGRSDYGATLSFSLAPHLALSDDAPVVPADLAVRFTWADRLAHLTARHAWAVA